MSVPSKPDRSLLDRLNALKPSSVSLAPPQQALGAPAAAAIPTADESTSSAFSASAPVSREDDLAARLKTLRHASDYGGGAGFEKPAEPSSESAAVTANSGSKVQDEGAKEEAGAESDEDDPLFFVDDQAVNDLLLELAAEGLGEEDDDAEDEADRLARGDGIDDDEILPLPDVPVGLGDESSGGEDEDDPDNSKQVEDLLRSLAGTTSLKGDAEADGQKDGGDPDDSDGDDMGREVRRVLAQARDEAGLAKQQRGYDNNAEEGEEDIVSGPRKRDLDQEDESILPRDKLSSSKSNDNKNGNHDDESNPLGLPAVPTKLVDPPPTSLPSVPTKSLPKRGDDEDISTRLAALRGLQGKTAGLGQTDAFGLPSAPTFRPGEEEGGVLKKGHLGYGRRNYTDADQKAWCVVCLEDATVRCLGCADDNEDDEETDQNNAYCTRCWRDMHVGPAAGFDERGHKRVPLVR